MNTKKIITIQCLSLLILIISANGFLEALFPTLLFIISFIVFAKCSLYIEKNEDRLLNDIRKKYI